MKKIITALIVALGLSGSIQAQELRTDIPPFPTVKTQISFTQKGEGKVEITDGNKATLATGSNTLVDYGVSQTFTLTPAKGNKVKSLVINGEAETLSDGTETNKLLSKTFTQSFKEPAALVATFVEKDTIQVMVSNTTQTEGNTSDIVVTTVPATISGPALTITYPNGTRPTVAGTYIVKITRDEDAEYKAVSETATLTINAKKNVDITTALLSASDILQGQPLSASILTGGVANYTETAGGTPVVVPGTFTWEKPSLIASESGTNSFNVLFTPTQSDVYNSQLVSVKVTVTAVYTVTTSVTGPQGCGSILIENATMDNRYVIGTKLTVKAIPNAGYKLTSLNGTSQTNMFESTTKEVPVSADAVINATFEKRTRQVNFTNPDQKEGTLTVLNGTTEIASGTAIDLGTELTVLAKPTAGYALNELYYEDNGVSPATPRTLTGTTLTVLPQAGDVAINLTASFVQKLSNNYTIQLDKAMVNGTVKVINDGAISPVGTQIGQGTKVTIEAVANTGYAFKEMSINGNVIKTQSIDIAIDKDQTILATFEKQTYEIKQICADDVTLTINGASNLTEAPYGTELTITATERTPDSHKMTALMVDNQTVGIDPQSNTYKVTVKAPMRIDAQSVALTKLSITKKEKTVVYNTAAQSFEVAANVANVAGYKLTYEKKGTTTATATEAGTYNVYVERAADDVFAILLKTLCGTLTIKKADVAILEEPTYASSGTPTGGEATVKGSFTQGNVANGFCAVTFTPTDTDNYNTATCMIPTASNHAKSTLTFTGLKSMLRAASIPAPNGSFGVYNGSSLITDSKAWQGVTITLNPIPQDGYYFIGWDKVEIAVTNGSVVNQSKGQIKIGAAATTKATEATTTITLKPKSSATPLFAAKETPTPSISSQSVPYDGKAHFVTPGKGWKVTYKQKTVEVTTPQNAGTYEIWLQREQTESEKAYSSIKYEATLTISKATVKLTAPTASEVQAGDKLMSSILSGGAATYGSNNKAVGGKFAWSDPGSPASSGTSVVKFLLDNATNFSEPANMDVIVPVATATKFAVTYTPTQNGTLTVKTTSGEDVPTGSAFVKGTELMIQATPANGYKVASYNAGGAQPATGKETEPFKITIGDAAVSIVVTFEKITTPATLVQSIELAPKKKTLNIGETLTFTTIILPTNASNKALTWKSSDDKVATVNAGQVKAIAVGTAVITATAADGSKAYDMCVLTVEVATPPTPPTPAIGISLNIHAKALAIGGTFTLTATVAPSTANQQVKWTTSDKTVATVDENGKVKAIAAGTANVTATTKDGEFSDKCEVTVIATTPVAVTGIKLDMTTLRLGINKIDTLTATITPATATNKKIIWTSSNPKIVSITATTLNNKIKLKGLKHGSAAIIAMTEDGHFLATCDVTVYDPTGIEELLANTRVYPLNGAICIDPAQPVEVTVISLSGAQIYREKLTTAYQIPVATGVYLVVLSDGKHQGTVKVFVK